VCTKIEKKENDTSGVYHGIARIISDLAGIDHDHVISTLLTYRFARNHVEIKQGIHECPASYIQLLILLPVCVRSPVIVLFYHAWYIRKTGVFCIRNSEKISAIVGFFTSRIGHKCRHTIYFYQICR
ncbi:unnamed protein product, partial [Laminaria digitata]